MCGSNVVYAKSLILQNPLFRGNRSITGTMSDFAFAENFDIECIAKQQNRSTFTQNRRAAKSNSRIEQAYWQTTNCSFKEALEGCFEETDSSELLLRHLTKGSLQASLRQHTLLYHRENKMSRESVFI